jgi:DNA-binding LacI/PurR family transcriptional regulator
MSRATIFDVAKLAGVSIKTVSRVVNQEPNVRASTKERVEKAVEELSYRPDQSARNLASHRSHIIALVYDDPSAYEIPSAGYVIRMQAGALRACREANCELLIHPCNYQDKDVGRELKALIERVRPDGIVLAAPLSNMLKIVRAISATKTPFVRVSPGMKSDKDFTVSMNDRESSAEMTRYLASLGHKDIAFLTGHPEHKKTVFATAVSIFPRISSRLAIIRFSLARPARLSCWNAKIARQRFLRLMTIWLRVWFVSLTEWESIFQASSLSPDAMTSRWHSKSIRR